MGVRLATAEWRHLTYLNFSIDPSEARSLLPPGLEIDLWNGSAYLSVVGKLVHKLRVLGILLPQYQQYADLSAHLHVRRGKERGVFRLWQRVPQELSRKWFPHEKIEVGPTTFQMHFEEGGRDGLGRPFSNAVVNYQGEGVEWRVRSDGLPQPVNFDPDDPFFVEKKAIFLRQGKRTLQFPSGFLWPALLERLELPRLPLSLPSLPESVRLVKGFPVIFNR